MHVGAVGGIPKYPIVSRLSKNRIFAIHSKKSVVAGAPKQLIVARKSKERVVSLVADEQVIADLAVEEVSAAALRMATTLIAEEPVGPKSTI